MSDALHALLREALDDPATRRMVAEQLAPDLAALAREDEDGGRLLTLGQAAARISAHPQTVGRWARDGRLPGARRVGQRWRIPVATIDALGDVPEAPGDPGRPAGRRRPRRPPRPRPSSTRERLPITDNELRRAAARRQGR